MIEQRTMFVVESSHNVREILAMYDTEKNEVICYHYTDDTDWYGIFDDERYFATKQQADDYVANRQEQLRAKFKEVKAFIKEMYHVDKELFDYNEDDFFDRYASFESRHTDWYNEFKDERKRAKIYLDCIRTGYLNINAASFRPEDVKYIKWYNGKAKLYLKSDETIETHDSKEYEIIEEIFGANKSAYTFQTK